jgi:hypothetical protein
MHSCFFRGNMNNYLNLNIDINSATNRAINRTINSATISGVYNVNHNNTHHGEYYATMDLCSQAQMLEDSDNILMRMNKLRVYARQQQTKRVKPQRQQTSFCF